MLGKWKPTWLRWEGLVEVGGGWWRWEGFGGGRRAG